MIIFFHGSRRVEHMNCFMFKTNFHVKQRNYQNLVLMESATFCWDGAWTVSIHLINSFVSRVTE